MQVNTVVPPTSGGMISVRTSMKLFLIAQVSILMAVFDTVQRIMNENNISVTLTLEAFRPGGRWSNLHKQRNFLLRKTRQIVSMDFWMKCKKVFSKLQQVNQYWKWQFWDSICQNASNQHFLYKTFRKIKNWSCSPPDTYLYILHDDDSLVSDANS